MEKKITRKDEKIKRFEGKPQELTVVPDIWQNRGGELE